MPLSLIFSFIGVLSPHSGPQLLSSSRDDLSYCEWLLRRVLSDVDVSDQSHNEEFAMKIGVKIECFQQLEIICVSILFRESDAEAPEYSIPTYSISLVLDLQFRWRLSFCVESICDRLRLLAQSIVAELRNSDCDISTVNPQLAATWMSKVIDLSADVSAWTVSVVTRAEVEVLDATKLSDWCSKQLSTSTLLTFLSSALSHRRLIVRGTCVDEVEIWVRTALLFSPDERLLFSSLNCSDRASGIVPDLFVQGTTCEVDDELSKRLLYFRFPAAVIDIDHLFTEPFHVEHLTLAESLLAEVTFRRLRVNFFLNNSCPSVAALTPLRKKSFFVAEVLGTLARILTGRTLTHAASNSSFVASDVQFSEVLSLSFSSASGSSTDLIKQSQIFQEICVAQLERWRRSLHLLAVRQSFFSSSVELRLLIPKRSNVDMDILTFFFDVIDSTKKVEIQFSEVESKMCKF